LTAAHLTRLSEGQKNVTAVSPDRISATVADLLATEPATLDALATFVAFPSVSAQSERADAIRAAAAHLADVLTEIGFTAVEVCPTAGYPVVVGDLLRAAPDAPTLLIYGHLDVQPVEPLDQWRTDPWTMTPVGDRVYGRGVADDKGQIWIHLAALGSLLRTGAGRMPVNVRVVVECEEEIGSPNMADFIRSRPDRFAADAVLVSDTPTYQENVPAIGYTLRGLCSMEVELRTLHADLHSGQFGGAVPNAAREMAALIASLHDETGRVAVEGYDDDVIPIEEQEAEALRGLPFDESAWLAKAGARALVGESGYSALELTWVRPTLEVSGAFSGHTGEGTKTIVPGRAVCKLTARLVPGMTPEATLDRIEAHVRAAVPSHVDLTITRSPGMGRPYYISPVGRFFDAARTALAEAFGAPVQLIRDGGAIPIVPLLASELGHQVLLLGFGCPDEAKHAPNEWLSLHHFRCGTEALVRFFLALDPDPQ
jgi:acetylornithine deacetylase/succinyl-diaminopimelate desuccinylase-like protein